MAKTHCVFCNRTRKRGKEHLWPVWLHKYLNTTDQLHAGSHHAISGGVVTRRVQRSLSLVAGNICEPCNTGWMAQLEDHTAPVVRAILDLASVTSALLSRQQVETLATWSFKTAIVRNLATNYRKVVPRSHYRYLFEHRRPAPSVYVDCAICPTQEGLTAIQSQSVLGLARPGDEPLLTSMREAIYTVVLAVGPLLLRVIHLPFRGYNLFPNLQEPGPARRLHPFNETELRLDAGVFARDITDFEMGAHFRFATVEGTA